MWLVYAFLSSITAAFVAVFGKVGLFKVDSTLATTVRSIIMALFLVVVSISLQRFCGFSLASFTGKQ